MRGLNRQRMSPGAGGAWAITSTMIRLKRVNLWSRRHPRTDQEEARSQGAGKTAAFLAGPDDMYRMAIVLIEIANPIIVGK